MGAKITVGPSKPEDSPTLLIFLCPLMAHLCGVSVESRDLILERRLLRLELGDLALQTGVEALQLRQANGLPSGVVLISTQISPKFMTRIITYLLQH